MTPFDPDPVSTAVSHAEIGLALAEHLGEEMIRRWRAGERPPAEEFLARHPELWEQPEAAMELIAEELSLRQEMGVEADAAELENRFPRWRQPVRILLKCHRLLAPSGGIPAVGAMLGDFRLLAELGRGAQGRVFLAAQPSLAGRPVVLKVSYQQGAEHLCLARLQHTHIVPLFSVHEFPEQGLHGLCLPYLGGATLTRLLDALPPVGQRTGRDLLEALKKSQASSPVTVPVAGPACRFLGRASYVQAVCWLGVCLADALQYAHEGGLVHLDVKPSNVLLAADGQPLLLDFHLARETLPPASPPPATLGGTPGYMSPEHREALTAVRERRAVARPVDGRADVYSLGVVLCEALAGALPAAEVSASGLRRANPHVPAGLAKLLARCVAAEPAKRYPTAGALAADLRRFLADLPLQGVADRSPIERWWRWRRRRPYDLPLLLLLLAAGVGTVLFETYRNRQTDKARAALAQGRQFLAADRQAEALESFQNGLMLVEDLPFTGGLLGEFREGVAQAERSRTAHELHETCERLGGWEEVGALSEEEHQAVEEACTRIWRDRERIARHLDQETTTALGAQVRVDLVGVALLLSELHVRRAPADRLPQVRRKAIQILGQAERLLGPDPALEAAIRKHLGS